MHKANYIAITNNKGGVGKSHLVFNVSLILSSGLVKVKNKKKLKVLAVELDPQSNSSNLFINSGREVPDNPSDGLEELRCRIEENEFAMGYDLLRETAEEDDLSILEYPLFQPNPDNFDLSVMIAAGTDTTIFHQIKSESPLTVAKRIQYRLDALVEKHKFDIVLLDTGPGETQVEMLAALHVATDVLIPINMNSHSSTALTKVRSILQAVQLEKEKEGESVNVAGLIMNLLSSQSSAHRKFHSQLSESFPEYADLILKTGLQYLLPWEKQTHMGFAPWMSGGAMKLAQRKMVTEQLKFVVKQFSENLSDGITFYEEGEEPEIDFDEVG